MSKEHYIPGDWWVLCDACQRKVRASQVTKDWKGRIVHADPNEGCFETRHPQEFVRAVKDNHPLPFVRPDNDGEDLPFEVHALIENADWAQIPEGTFQTTDYDWE